MAGPGMSRMAETPVGVAVGFAIGVGVSGTDDAVADAAVGVASVGSSDVHALTTRNAVVAASNSRPILVERRAMVDGSLGLRVLYAVRVHLVS